VSRQYLALVHGVWIAHDAITVQLAVGRDPHNRLRMAARATAGIGFKPAGSVFTVLQNAEHGALAHCALQTGRTHQIRVHAAALGHPLVGDSLYGGREAAGLTRQALHAWRLAFRHPASGEALRFQVDPPPDFLQACSTWGLRYNAAEPFTG
jgi:23S rRNA pseudouridine1911/1915/1917 synthase